MSINHFKEWINKLKTRRQHTYTSARSSTFPHRFGDIKASCSTIWNHQNFFVQQETPKITIEVIKSSPFIAWHVAPNNPLHWWVATCQSKTLIRNSQLASEQVALRGWRVNTDCVLGRDIWLGEARRVTLEEKHMTPIWMPWNATM